MRIELERHVCQGHGVCQMTAPNLFTLSDEDGLAIQPSNPIAPESQDEGRLAVASCPERSLRVIEE
ncbi:ferredoxin [Paeniglutamicibacter sp. ORCA_105]|uniref:ferredoxin n=1 Tax=Paeniglutamicibacter sp. ORCA_105 TaxID=3377336 RepID=UPI003895E9AB